MMFADIPHNGYTNYETWLVKATVDNTESLYNLCKNIYNEDPENAQANIYNKLLHMISNMAPKANNNMWECLINSVIKDRINFSEIAKTFIDEFSTN